MVTAEMKNPAKKPKEIILKAIYGMPRIVTHNSQNTIKSLKLFPST
jgi:hypothetical protein